MDYGKGAMTVGPGGARRRGVLLVTSVVLVLAVAAWWAAVALDSRAAGSSLTLVPATSKTCAPPLMIVGQGCLDGQGHGASDGWTFSATSAQQHYLAQWITMYSWTVPASVPATGATIPLQGSAQELTHNPNASICADIGVGGSFSVSDPSVHVCAESGKTASASATATIIPQSGGDETLTIGLQYGPFYTYNYTAGPSSAPKYQCTSGSQARVSAAQAVSCNVTLRVVSPKGSAFPKVALNTWVSFSALVRGLDMTQEKLVFRWRPQSSAGSFSPLSSCTFKTQCDFYARSQIARAIEFDAAVVDFSGDVLLQSNPVTVVWAAEQPQLHFDYTVPQRFGLTGSDGLIEYQTTVDQIQPREWPVDLTVANCPSPDTHIYTWKYVAPWGAMDYLDAERSSGCTWRAQFPGAGHPRYGEGTYDVTLTVVSKPGQQQEEFTAEGPVTIRDFLILGLGDSLASGEGNPDQPGGTAAKWENLQCDRSAISYQAQVALMLEQKDPKTSVTFVHLGCSGASIIDHNHPPRDAGGLLDPYTGINPGPRLPGQVDEVKRLIGSREVDAILLSAGVNDFEFGNVVKFCARWDVSINRNRQNDCFGEPYTDTTGTTYPTLAAFLQARFKLLPDEYQRLGDALATIAPPNRVFITNYPDSLHNDNGELCARLNLTAPAAPTLKGRAPAAITRVAVILNLLNKFLLPLNTAIDATHAYNHWNVVTLTGTDFRDHGYCAGNHWIVTRNESFQNQGNDNGTLHPNKAGHDAIAAVVYPVVEAQLYPGGKARPPQ